MNRGFLGIPKAVTQKFASLVVTGLAGARTSSEWVGGTASGPPTTGYFVAGSWVVDQLGKRWTCTVSGNPGTWVQEPGTGGSVMVASGPSHAAGLAPDPGVTAGTTKFLREDATWGVPPGSGASQVEPVCDASGSVLVTGSGEPVMGPYTA